VCGGGAYQARLDAAGSQRVQAPAQLVGARSRVAFDEPLGFERTQRARDLTLLPPEALGDAHHAETTAAQAFLAGQFPEHLHVPAQPG
jgi:hypothetical protein